jgi:glucosyl-3-phosphoglycerate synthase
MINGLQYDRHEEEIEVQVFAKALRESIGEFLADPSGPPLVPNWSRVWAGIPEAGPLLMGAVEQGPA